MPAQLSLTQSQAQVALRSFLLGILPTGVEVVAGQDNRVPEPAVDDFIVMWPIRKERLETNVDSYVDAKFIGSIVGNVLTVSAVAWGEIVVGRQLFGVGVAANTVVTGVGTGSGGIGTYTVSVVQNVPEETMACGVSQMLQPTNLTMQLDVHGSNASDNVQIISTAFRDAYAVEQFDNSGVDVGPLYAEDPRQVPFINEEEQYEFRWTIELHLQLNASVNVPLQFADAVNIGLISVDAVYPP